MSKIKYNKSGKLIMGINGWLSGSHDASVALIEVTKTTCNILTCIEEEKVVGIKGEYDKFPIHAIQDALNMYSIGAKDIDEVVFGWDYPQLYNDLKMEWPFENDQQILNILFNGDSCYEHIKITFIPHHLSHAASSYRTSGFDTTLSIVMDGNGEHESFSVWKGQDDELIQLHNSSIESSFGFVFEAANVAMSFRTNESGKTMGLAAYGKPIYFEQIMNLFENDSMEVSDKFKKMYSRYKRFSDQQSLLFFQSNAIKTWITLYQNMFGIGIRTAKVNSFYEYEDKYKDLASTIQRVLENKITSEVKKWINITGINNVCMSGGVGLNCTMNGKILALDDVKSFYSHPAAGDSGVALGCALERAHRMGYCSRIKKAFSPYLGTQIDNSDIIKYCKLNGIKYRLLNDASKEIVSRLCNGETIAVFQGRNEWGPRALGARSILSLPVEGKLDFINAKVKERELGRPLGPSMLQSDAQILNSSFKTYGKYMNIAYTAEHHNKEYASILHKDLTYRPQFVDESMNEVYHHQLSELKLVQGSSIVINTSFNHTTPIVYNVHQAVQFYNTKEITMLAFNNEILLEK